MKVITGSAVRLFSTWVRDATKSNIERKLFVIAKNDIRFQTPTEKTLKTTPMGTEFVNERYLIVGLRNPTMPESRHSVGAQVLDRLAKDLDLQWIRRNDCLGYIATLNLNERVQVMMLKPKHFMNVNGKSVANTVRHHKIDIDKVYIMQDDMRRHLGKASITQGGSPGGHNGVKSVLDLLRGNHDVNKMFKVRIGIGKPSSDDKVIEHVFGNFTEKEMTGVQEGVLKAIQQWAWHLEGRGVDVHPLTDRYGINPKVAGMLQRTKHKEKKKMRTVLSDKTDLGMQATTHSEEGVSGMDKP